MQQEERVLIALRNLENPAVLRKRIRSRTHWDKLRVWVVWGLFPGEPVHLHLGHLHVLQKTQDLLIAGLDARIVINDYVEGAGGDEQAIFDLRATADRMAEFLRLVLTRDVGADSGREVVVVGSRLCEEKDSRAFRQRWEQLSDAQNTVVEAFRPVQELDQRLGRAREAQDSDLLTEARDMLGRAQQEIEETLQVTPEEYDHLYKMVVSKYYAPQTDWSPRFGALVLDKSHRPDFVVVGRRHAYVWTYYSSLFKLARVRTCPAVLWVGDFMNVTGTGPMEAADRGESISTVTPEHQVKSNLERVSQHPENCALSNAVDYLLVPRHGDLEGARSYDELHEKCRGRLPGLVDAVLPYLIKLLRDYKEQWNLMEAVGIGEYQPITNYKLFEFVGGCVGLSVPPLVSQETINREPDRYMEDYRELLKRVTQEFIALEGPHLFGVQPRMKYKGLTDALGDLAKLADDSATHDLMLYLTNKRYRDHFVHQFNVGALGWLLLECWVNEKRRLWEVVGECSGLSTLVESAGILESGHVRALVSAVWWTSALLHDHAYAASFALRVLPRLRQLSSDSSHPLIIDSLEDAYTRAMDLLAPQIRDSLVPGESSQQLGEVRLKLGTMVEQHLRGVLKDVDSDIVNLVSSRYVDTHGVIGALNVILRVRSREIEPVSHLLALVARAILFHHVTEKRLSFEDDCFAFLLMLCDEIQEWGRRLLLEDEYRCPMIHISLGPFKRHPLRGYILGNTLYVEFEYDVPQSMREEEQVGWSYDRFISGKDRSFGRLVWPPQDRGMFPASMRYAVKIPSRVFADSRA